VERYNILLYNSHRTLPSPFLTDRSLAVLIVSFPKIESRKSCSGRLSSIKGEKKILGKNLGKKILEKKILEKNFGKKFGKKILEEKS
jgi:hypothetical protein